MKVIKPVIINSQNMTSNIPEPDPASGEAVYVESDKTLKSISGANDLKSLSHTAGSGYFISASKDTTVKTVAKYDNDSLASTGSVSIYNQMGEKPFTGGIPTSIAASGNVILVCTLNDVGLIYRSADRGNSWQGVNVGIGSSQRPVSVVSFGVGKFACNYFGKVRFSIDGGVTWVNAPSYNANPSRFDGNSQVVFDGSKVCLMGYLGRVVYNESMSSAQQISDSANMSGRCVAAVNGFIYAVQFISGQGFKVRSSSNSGVTFSTGVDIAPTGSPYLMTATGSWVLISTESTIHKIKSDFTGDFIRVVGAQSARLSAFGGFAFAFTASGAVFSIDAESSAINAIDSVSSGVSAGSTRADVVYMAASTSGDVVYMVNSRGRGSGAALFSLPMGAHSISGQINSLNNTSISNLSMVNYTNTDSELVLANQYSADFAQRIASIDIELESTPLTSPTYGQACADTRYIYQLIRSGNWFVYKMDTALGISTKLDLGAQNSGYIDAFNSNPYIFIVGDNLNIPINKAAAPGVFDAVLRLDKTPASVVEIAPNQLLDSKSLGAVYNAENVLWFLDNNKVELTDAVNFDQLGGYREGDEIISLSTHRRYRATTNTLDTPEIGSQKTPPTWTDIAPTNKYAAFSTYIHNRTESQSDIYFEFQGVNSDSISLFGMVNAEMLELRGYNSSGAQIYTNDLVLLDSDSIDVFGEIRLLDSVVVTDINSDVARLSVKLLKGGEQSTVAVGRIVVGKALALGVSQYGASLSIEDFSRRERDEFGNFTIAQRSTAKNINFDVKVDKRKVNAVFRLLSELTTIPCVWLGDDNDAALQVYGFYSDYTHNIDYPSITSATINVEGLT